MELEAQWFINDLKNCKLEPHEFFVAYDAFPLVEYVVLPNIDFLCSNENIGNSPSNVKSPLFSFRVDDTIDEIWSPCISRFIYFQLCRIKKNIFLHKCLSTFSC